MPEEAESLPEPKYDWDQSVYHGIEEDIPTNCPPPRGKSVHLTTYVDANLMHCRVTGHSVSGIIHFLNSTVIDTFLKKQPVVEAATYGSEFYAGHISVQHKKILTLCQVAKIRLLSCCKIITIFGLHYMFR